jgi:hypothetical protein
MFNFSFLSFTFFPFFLLPLFIYTSPIDTECYQLTIKYVKNLMQLLIGFIHFRYSNIGGPPHSPVSASTFHQVSIVLLLFS